MTEQLLTSQANPKSWIYTLTNTLLHVKILHHCHWPW